MLKGNNIGGKLSTQCLILLQAQLPAFIQLLAVTLVAPRGLFQLKHRVDQEGIKGKEAGDGPKRHRVRRTSWSSLPDDLAQPLIVQDGRSWQ